MPYPKVIHFVQSVQALFSDLPTVSFSCSFYQTFLSHFPGTRHTPHATRHTPHATRHTPHAVRPAHSLNVPPLVSTASYHSVLHLSIRTQYEAAHHRHTQTVCQRCARLSCQSWHEHITRGKSSCVKSATSHEKV
jgi:hypothetical protein